jgi:hypothetical protein
MPDINPPKSDRVGNDFHTGPNPNPGGTIDTADSLVPPYDDRNKGRNERSEGPERMLNGEAPPKEAIQAESAAAPRDDAKMAPEGVGQSMTRGGEKVSTEDGKEAGRFDSGSDGSKADRPTGGSTPRDLTGVNPQDGPAT